MPDHCLIGNYVWQVAHDVTMRALPDSLIYRISYLSTESMALPAAPSITE